MANSGSFSLCVYIFLFPGALLYTFVIAAAALHISKHQAFGVVTAPPPGWGCKEERTSYNCKRGRRQPPGLDSLLNLPYLTRPIDFPSIWLSTLSNSTRHHRFNRAFNGNDKQWTYALCTPKRAKARVIVQPGPPIDVQTTPNLQPDPIRKKHPRRYPEFDNRHPNGAHVFNMSFSSSESASSLCSSSVFLLPSYPFPGSDKNRSSYRPTIRHFDHVKITNVLLFKQKLLQQFEITMGIYYQDNMIV